MPERVSNARRGAKMQRILVVDDEHDFRQRYTEALSDEGYYVTKSFDLRELKDKIRKSLETADIRRCTEAGHVMDSRAV